MSLLQTTALLASLAASVSAHGYVQGIVADGTYYSGYNPSFQYQDPPPTVIGWSDPEDQSNGFIAPSAYADPDIICHLSATPGGTSAKVPAGGKVELEWTVWPDSHHGPVLDYLAPVSGAWADIDKTTLEFTKISQGGLIDGSASPGKWASDELIANNNTWSVTIPTSIAPGKYVLRHEIIALHSAGQEDGAQNYPQCINLEITGTGTDSLSTGGTLGTALYKEDDPGILINIYTALSSYTIPGPALYSGAASGSQTAAASSTAAAAKTGSASSAVVASTTAAAVSASSTAAYTSTAAPYANVSTPATTTSAAASTTSAAPVETTPYTTVDETTTAYTTVTSTPTAAPYSAPASVASAALSEAPSATSSSVASPTGAAGTKWGDLPSKELPAGWTLKDLLDWVAYLTKPSWNKGVHARDFKRFAAKML